MSENSLPLRSEVKVADTWDLTTIYPSNEAWEEEFNALSEQHSQAAKFKGHLGDSATVLYEAIKLQEDIFQRLSKAYVYVHLNFDTDTTNAQFQAYDARILALYAQIAQSFSFYSSELMSLDENLIKGYLDELPELAIYKHDFAKLFKQREHILSDKEEEILAGASEIFENSETTFGMLNNADMKFPKVKDEQGQEVQLSHGRYGILLESKDRSVREGAFRAMYSAYKNLLNTFASTLSGKVKTDNYLARVRHFSSARQAALSNNDIPEAVYDALIEAVNENLSLLQRYIAIRKKVLGLDEIAMYDLYTPLVSDVDLKFTFEEAKEIVLAALAPLGEEYQVLLHKAFDSRWIDVVENKGKRSGAYSSGTYGTNPFVLLNWQDNLDNVFTLAHELGHSMHSYYTRNYQPYVYGDYSIFVAEIASTTNENLLTDFLLKKYEDPAIRAYVLNHYLDGFKGTIFRQTQFAEFELLMHKAQQDGIGLTAEYLSEEYFKLNEHYYGPDVHYDAEIADEWARIPHFYYNYYVFQYATGFSAASALAQKILTEGQPAVTAYINYLKSGSSDYPIEVMKKAGVDMTSDKPVRDAMKVFEQRLNELEGLLK